MIEFEPKPLLNNVYFKILAFLANEGIFKRVKINHILDEYFTYDRCGNSSDEKYEYIKYFLGKMEANKHIEYDTVEDREGTTIVDVLYLGVITIEGLIFFSKIQENTSILTTNTALTESFKTSKYLSKWAISISIISLIFSLYVTSKPPHEDALLQVLSQKKQIELIQQQLSTIKNLSYPPSKGKTIPKK
jgi:hypothetical protein